MWEIIWNLIMSFITDFCTWFIPLLLVIGAIGTLIRVGGRK